MKLAFGGHLGPFGGHLGTIFGTFGDFGGPFWSILGPRGPPGGTWGGNVDFLMIWGTKMAPQRVPKCVKNIIFSYFSVFFSHARFFLFFTAFLTLRGRFRLILDRPESHLDL